MDDKTLRMVLFGAIALVAMMMSMFMFQFTRQDELQRELYRSLAYAEQAKESLYKLDRSMAMVDALRADIERLSERVSTLQEIVDNQNGQIRSLESRVTSSQESSP